MFIRKKDAQQRVLRELYQSMVLPVDVEELVNLEDDIAAIKRLRELTGLGLREAKLIIDSKISV